MSRLSGIPFILLAILTRWSNSLGSQSGGASCYDCNWFADNYSGFHKCALEQEDDAFYIYERSCESERCFIRKDLNGQIFRGCADKWNLPWGINTTLNCVPQGQSASIWWFCDGHLCNDGLLHDATRCGEPEPETETETPPFYYEEPYEADVRGPEEHPTEIHEEPATTESSVEPETEITTKPVLVTQPSIEEPEYAEYQQPEYTIDEETVHGIGFYDNFRDVEETRPMAPVQPLELYQNDPKRMPQSQNVYDTRVHRPMNKPRHHDQGRRLPAEHHPKIYNHGGLHPPKRRPRIYDHGGLHPTKNRKEIIHDRGVLHRNTKKGPSAYARPRYGPHKDHSAEPFWMWWWHSGAFQHMSPQEAYWGYLNKRAPPTQSQASYPKKRVSEKEEEGSRKRQKGISGYQREWHPGQWHQRPYFSMQDYAPIRSNFYYSRISSKRRQDLAKKNTGYRGKSSVRRPTGRVVYQQDTTSKSHPAQGAKAINPLDYRSFKPPHTYSIVEPLGPVPGEDVTGGEEKEEEQAARAEPLKPILDQREEVEEGGKVKTGILSKEDFYEYYDNFKLGKHDGRVRGHATAKDDYNPCSWTCRHKFHKDPVRPNGFIQCGPGSHHGSPCTCCQPYYHICPKETSFDDLHKVCSRTGSSIIEDKLYKSLDLYAGY